MAETVAGDIKSNCSQAGFSYMKWKIKLCSQCANVNHWRERLAGAYDDWDGEENHKTKGLWLHYS